MAVVDELLVKLAVDSAQMRTGLNDAKSQLGAFSGALQSIGKQVSGALTFSALKQAGRAVKELAHFVFDGAKAAAASGDVAAQGFLANVTKMEGAFKGVAAQAASQLAPALEKITSRFLESKTAAEALKGAGNFVANIFRVLASVGTVVVGIFRGIGQSIGAVASMIVDVLAGNFSAAADTWRENAADMKKIATETAGTLSDVWTQGNDYKGPALTEKKKKEKHGPSESERQAAAGVAQQQVLSGITEQANARIAEFARIGETATEALRRSTVGYGDHAAAMTKWATESRMAAGLQAVATELTKQGHLVEAEQAKARAAAFSTSAGKALDAAKAFEELKQKELKDAEEFNKEIAEKAKTQAEEQRKAIAEAAEAEKKERERMIQGLASTALGFVSKMGAFGEVVSAAVQGAQAGGIWGAIIAVVFDLLSRLEGFQRIIDIGNGMVQMALTNMAGGLGSIINVLGTLMGALSSITKAVHGILGPILEIISKALERLAPMFITIGTVLGIVGATLQPVFTILGAIFDILKIFNPILTLVTLSMMGLKLGIEYVNLGFQMFLDWVLEKLGQNNNSGVTSAQNAVNRTQNEIIALAKQLEKDPFNALTNHSNAAADDLEELGKTTEETKKGLDKLNGSLTNVPEGFKVALRRYDASNPMQGWHDSGGGGGAGGSGQQLHVHVEGNVLTEGELISKLKDAFAKGAWVKYGSRFVRQTS